MARRRPTRVAPIAALSLALALSSVQLTQVVQAAERIYYAAAIGEAYLPSRSTPTAAEPRQFSAPAASPELPALGAKAAPRAGASTGGMGVWSKVLIGVAVVATMALVAKSGGGASVDIPVGGDTAGGSSSGGGGSGGGSGGGGSGGGHNDDDDDDDRGKSKGKGKGK